MGQFMPSDEAVAGLKADLLKYEAARVGAHRSVMWRVPLFLGLLLIAIFLAAQAINGIADVNEQWISPPHVFLYVLGFAASFFVYSLAVRPATKLQQAFRERALPTIFGFIDGVSYSQGRTPESFDRLPKETLGAFNRQSFDDVVAGRYEDFPFELYEMTLSQKAGKSTSEVFKGIVVAFETITPFPGLLVATRRTAKVVKFFRGIFGTQLEELQSGITAIDESYEFRTDNADAARPLVTGRLARALQWLGETWPEQPSRVALRGSDGFLLIPLTKNFFELPSISVPLDYNVHVQPMIADMASLLATASLVRKIGMPDDASQTAQP